MKTGTNHRTLRVYSFSAIVALAISSNAFAITCSVFDLRSRATELTHQTISHEGFVEDKYSYEDQLLSITADATGYPGQEIDVTYVIFDKKTHASAVSSGLLRKVSPGNSNGSAELDVVIPDGTHDGRLIKLSCSL